VPLPDAPRWDRLLQRLLRREGRPSPDAPGGAVVHHVEQLPDDVEAYWDEDRVRDARPRELRRDEPQSSTDSPGANRP
jgi:hypothetical protein